MSLSGCQSVVKKMYYKGRPAITKSSKYVDYSIELESKILTRIKQCELLTPHFANLYETRYVVDKNGYVNPTMVIAFVENEEFRDFMAKKLAVGAVDLIKNMVCMTLCACELLYQTCGIIHNDLHTSNVLIKKTDAEFVEYKFQNKVYRYKTFGYFPVIIDFGYAFVAGDKIQASLMCTDIGYSIHKADRLADARILLTKVSSALKKYGLMKCNLRKTIKSIFDPLDLTENGWFPDDTFICPVDEMMDMVEAHLEDSSGIFNSEESDCEDLMSLFTGNMDITKQNHPESDDINQIFKEFKFHAKLRFRQIGPKKQLVMVKNWLDNKEGDDIIYNLCQKVVNGFSDIVFKVLNNNDLIKEEYYSELDVKTTLDVLDVLQDNSSDYDMTCKTMSFDFSLDNVKCLSHQTHSNHTEVEA